MNKKKTLNEMAEKFNAIEKNIPVNLGSRLIGESAESLDKKYNVDVKYYSEKDNGGMIAVHRKMKIRPFIEINVLIPEKRFASFCRDYGLFGY